MSGTRGWRGRIVAIGLGLALALMLSGGGEAKAGKYAVAQCGWHLGADAVWADTTGGAKFRPPPIARAPASGRPLRRRPPEELHPRGAGRPSPAPVSPAGAGRRRPGTGIVAGARHLVARPPRRASSTGSGPIGGDGGFAPVRLGCLDRRRPARFRRWVLTSRSGRSRTACSAPAARASRAASRPDPGRACGR